MENLKNYYEKLTQAQEEKLTSLGCKFAQGYYFGKPVPAKVLTPQLVSL